MVRKGGRAWIANRDVAYTNSDWATQPGLTAWYIFRTPAPGTAISTVLTGTIQGTPRTDRTYFVVAYGMGADFTAAAAGNSTTFTVNLTGGATQTVASPSSALPNNGRVSYVDATTSTPGIVLNAGNAVTSAPYSLNAFSAPTGTLWPPTPIGVEAYDTYWWSPIENPMWDILGGDQLSLVDLCP